jgi:hypothetical protein
MSYSVAFDRKPQHLHAVITGENNRENVISYLQDVQRECVASGCFRVLIEERLEGPRLAMLDVFKIASRESFGTLEQLPTIAYVDVNAIGSSMAFAEDVAVNRGINVRVFNSVTDAEQWLHGLPSTDSKAEADASDSRR